MILIIGDLHWSTTPPGSRKNNYEEILKQKLDEILSIAADSSYSAVIFTGDLFHKKGCKVTYKEFQQLLSFLQSFKVPLYCVAGNHDCPSTHIEGTPFGCLIESKALTLLTDSTEIDHIPIRGCQWHPSFDSDPANYIFSDCSIIVTHGMLLQQPLWHTADNIKRKDRGYTLFDEIHHLAPSRYLVINGHVHEPAYSCRKNTHIINAGSIGRTSISQSHHPSVFSFNPTTPTFSVKQIKLQSALPIQDVCNKPIELPSVNKDKVQGAINAISNLSFSEVNLWTYFDAISYRWADPVVSRAREVLEKYLNKG
jgi:DNA repair protein SbcD/Mre11